MPRRNWLSPRAWLAAAAAAVLLLAALAGFNPLAEPPTPTDQSPTFFGGSGQPGVSTLSDAEPLVFDYPSNWRVFRYEAVSSFTRLVAYLATVDVPDPCVRSGSSLTCGARYHLEPGTLVVTVTGAAFPGGTAIDNPVPGAVSVVVGGLPGLREPAPPILESGADQSVQWRFARPDSTDNWYEVRADIRGPGVEAMLAEVEALIDSVRWDTPEGAPSGSP